MPAKKRDACTMVELVQHQLTAMQGTIDQIHSGVKLQNGRVRKLERWRDILVGALFVLNLILGYTAKDLLSKMDEMYRFYIKANTLIHPPPEGSSNARIP